MTRLAMFGEREYYGNIWRNLVEIASNQLKEEREAAKWLSGEIKRVRMIGMTSYPVPSYPFFLVWLHNNITTQQTHHP